MAQIRVEEAAEQHEPNFTMHVCKYGICILQHQIVLNERQSHDYNCPELRYNPAEDYGLSRHVLIGTMTEVCPY
ncbi:hypothetical protein TNCV_3904011 [Trichonephila clavipes]|nr:hypothetical protein TNCV_3904011 [Trichonephila clavipes]